MSPVTSPPIAPASSPDVRTFKVPMFVAGMNPMLTNGEKGADCMLSPMFGYGTGMNGAGGAGVLQTSGKLREVPAPRLLAGNMLRLLFPIDRFGSSAW